MTPGPWKNILIATAADSGPAVAAPAGSAGAVVEAAVVAVAAGVAAVVADPAVSAAVPEAAGEALGASAAAGAVCPQSAGVAGVDRVAADSGSTFP